MVVYFRTRGGKIFGITIWGHPNFNFDQYDIQIPVSYWEDECKDPTIERISGVNGNFHMYTKKKFYCTDPSNSHSFEGYIYVPIGTYVDKAPFFDLIVSFPGRW